jgi:hypothetical protein
MDIFFHIHRSASGTGCLEGYGPLEPILRPSDDWCPRLSVSIMAVWSCAILYGMRSETFVLFSGHKGDLEDFNASMKRS